MVRLFVISLLLSVSAAFGQTKDYKSKIKLINGSEFHVVIKENYPGKYVKIILPGNKEAFIKYTSILSIKHKEFSYFSKHVQAKGFYIEGSTILLFGKATEQNGSRIGIALGVSANYQLNSYISVGVGAEPTALLITNENFLMPLYGRFKYTILERKVSPVLLINAGWSFALTNKENEFNTTYYDGGWYAKPSVGIQISKFTFSLGYQLQKITTTVDRNTWWGSNGITVEERIMKNISLSGSLRF